MAENLAAFYMMLFVSGIFYPKFAAINGIVLAVARVIYAIGYVQSKFFFF